jgi:hypothetical protein
MIIPVVEDSFMRRCFSFPIAVLISALLMLVIHVAPGWGQNAEPIGTVLAVDGTAEVRAQNKTTWEALRFRDAIFLQDTVRTGANSKLKVMLHNDSIMTISEQSEMVFSEFLLTPGRKRSVVNLLFGTLKTLTTSILGARASVEVHTPNAVAGVRGTIFVVRYVPPVTDVFVLEGVVTTQHSDPAIPGVVQAALNTHTRVVGAAAPTTPVPITVEERQAIERTLQLIEQVPSEVTPSEELAPTEEAPRGTEGGTQESEGTVQPDSTTVVVDEAPPETLNEQAADLVMSTDTSLDASLAGTAEEIITPDTTPTSEALLQELLLGITVEIPR